MEKQLEIYHGDFCQSNKKNSNKLVHLNLKFHHLQMKGMKSGGTFYQEINLKFMIKDSSKR